MVPFSTKKHIKTLKHRIHWNINIIKSKLLYEKINGSVRWNKHSGEQNNWKSNNTMSNILCTGATFVKKNSCLVVRIVWFDTAGLHLLTSHYPRYLSNINDVIIPIKYYIFESMLPSFPAAKASW